VSAMGLSVLVALILTPALCATILKPLPPSGHVEHTGFFKWFNKWFDRGREKHAGGLDSMLARSGRSMLVYLGIAVLMAVLYTRIPSAFLPGEDTGFMYGQVQTPPGASKERTWAALDQAQQYFTEKEKDTVDGVLTVNGFNFAGTGQNSGLLFIKLKDWDERSKPEQQIGALLGRANGEELSQSVWSAIERGLEYSMHMMLPDGRTPEIGGADDGKPIRLEHLQLWDFRPYLAIGAVVLRRGDFKTVAGRFYEDALWLLGSEGLAAFESMPATTPAATAVLMRSTGYFVARSDWSERADYVCFDVGEQAAGMRTDSVPNSMHGHADCLSVVNARR